MGVMTGYSLSCRLVGRRFHVRLATACLPDTRRWTQLVLRCRASKEVRRSMPPRKKSMAAASIWQTAPMSSIPPSRLARRNTTSRTSPTSAPPALFLLQRWCLRALRRETLPRPKGKDRLDRAGRAVGRWAQWTGIRSWTCGRGRQKLTKSEAQA